MFRRRFFLITICLVFLSFSVAITLNAESAILIDHNSGAILFEKNANEYRTPASLTKLAILYFVLSNFEVTYLDEYFLVTEDVWSQYMVDGAVSIGLKKGDRISLRELIEAVTVVSGNDAAYLLAYFFDSDLNEFMNKVNKFLHQKGFNDVHFEEPSGLNEYNRITAKDYVFLCKQIIDDLGEDILDFTSQVSFEYAVTNNQFPSNIRKNRNLLLQEYPGVDGLKTGFLKKSGYNLALTSQLEEQRLTLVLLGVKPNNKQLGYVLVAEDAIKLLNYGYGQLLRFTPLTKTQKDYIITKFNE